MDSLLTPYGERLNTQHPLGEYPRPQLQRDSYLNLNGRWQYAVTSQPQPPTRWAGDIIVPFSPESALSGVGHVLQPGEYLWYRKCFFLPPGFMKKRLLLHFGAVDRECAVFFNGTEVGGNDNGFLPFSLDVTRQMADNEQELWVRVSDETDTAPFARGRQRLQPGELWHSPQSGIWQTVWLESVPKAYVKNIIITPVYDEGTVEITVESRGGTLAGQVQVYARSALAAGCAFHSGEKLRLKLPGALSWHPNMPFLYTVKVDAGEDRVESYFGMRKIALEKDEAGQLRLMLNNKPFTVAGVLDQGWFSDGMLTPPSDNAMVQDIRYARECGFNLIRKHGKLEPLRWYYHCDKLGILVWQDLPAGGDEPVPTLLERVFGMKPDRPDTDHTRNGRQDEAGREAFVRDAKRVTALLQGSPSVCVWGLFQDGQGQFEAADLARKMRRWDPLRLVDHASGRFDQGGGDIRSVHLPAKSKKPLQPPPPDTARITVITGAGGLGYTPEGHFCGQAPWAPRLMDSRAAWAEAITAMYRDSIIPLLQQGASGYILTQLTDAQNEVSGLISCDRREKKINARGMATLNRLALEGAAAAK